MFKIRTTVLALAAVAALGVAPSSHRLRPMRVASAAACTAAAAAASTSVAACAAYRRRHPPHREAATASSSIAAIRHVGHRPHFRPNWCRFHGRCRIHVRWHAPWIYGAGWSRRPTRLPRGRRCRPALHLPDQGIHAGQSGGVQGRVHQGSRLGADRQHAGAASSCRNSRLRSSSKPNRTRQTEPRLRPGFFFFGREHYLGSKSVAQRAHARQHRRPTDPCARCRTSAHAAAEAQPLHHHEVVAGALVLADSAMISWPWHAADAHLFRADDAQFGPVDERRSACAARSGRARPAAAARRRAAPP